MKRFAYFIEDHQVIEVVELTVGTVRSDLKLLNQMSREFFGEGIAQLDLTGDVQHYIETPFGRIAVTGEQYDDDTVVGFFPPTQSIPPLNNLLR